MNLASGIVTFLLIWWTALFTVLPFGLKRGSDGKPDDPRLVRKVLMTTLLSALIWVALYGLIALKVLDFRAMAYEMVAADDHAKTPDFDVLCKSLTEYRMPEGVEYKGGEDVHGKPIVPADLGSGEGVGALEIPITIDLAARFGLSLPQGAEMKPDVAKMLIHPDGRVEYNGQDLTKQAYSVCRK